MRSELRRIEPLRAANVAGLVYGLVMGVFVLIFLPFFLLMAVFVPASGGDRGALFLMPLLLLVYPVLGAVMGWISGLIGAAVYNLVVRWTGGLLVELGDSSGPSDAGLA